MSDFGVFLLLFAALAGALGLIKFFAWLTDIREAGGPVAYARQASGRYIEPRAAPEKPVAAQVDQRSPTDAQWVAMQRNAINAELSGNAVAEQTPAEARDIIRMQAKAEAVVILLKKAKLTNKAEAIEAVFECSRTSRAGSPYQRALALVDPLLNDNPYPDRTPDQEQRRAELGLA